MKDIYFPEKKCSLIIVMDWWEIPQGPDLNRDFSRSRSQVIRSYCMHRWCFLSCLQSVSWEAMYITGWQFPLLRWSCVSGSQHNQSTFCVWVKIRVECLRFLSFGHFLYILFPPLISDSHFTFGFWVQCYFCCCSSIILIESSSGCGIYS